MRKKVSITPAVNQKTGFTLVELILASFMALMIITVILTVFSVGRGSYYYSRSSYTVAEDSYASIKWLKKDLMQTALSTIWVINDDQRSQMDRSGTTEYPVMILESAEDPATGNFTISRFGSPYWQKYLVYTLRRGETVSLGNNKVKTGSLIRYDLPLSGNSIPTIPKMFPGDSLQIPTGVTNPRVVLRNLVFSGQDIDYDGTIDDYNDFQISFIQRDSSGGDVSDVLTKTNPSQASPEDIGKNTELTQVDLMILEISKETGKPNIFSITFKVMPRN